MGSVTIQPAVRQETGKIAIGVGVLSVLTAGVYLILGRFNYTVLLGLLLGAVFAVCHTVIAGKKHIRNLMEKK